MAKRFTDTGKWDKAWFRKLEPTEKCIWLFLCDRCDHAGIWEVDMDALKFFVGTTWRLSDICSTFGDKVELIGEDKLLLTGFVEYQYGNLNPANRVHKSILDRVERLKNKVLSKPLPSPLNGAMEMDMELEKELDKGECEGKTPRITSEALEECYQAYPRKKGKSGGIRIAKREVKTPLDLANLRLAIERYKKNCQAEGTDKKFILHFSTFMGEWRDWLDPDAGKSESFAEVPIDTGAAAKERALFAEEAGEAS